MPYARRAHRLARRGARCWIAEAPLTMCSLLYFAHTSRFAAHACSRRCGKEESRASLQEAHADPPPFTHPDQRRRKATPRTHAMPRLARTVLRTTLGAISKAPHTRSLPSTSALSAFRSPAPTSRLASSLSRFSFLGHPCSGASAHPFLSSSSTLPPPSRPSLLSLLPQVRTVTYGSEYQPSQRVRKRRHGFLARIRSRGGRKVLIRRRMKGRRFLSH